MKKEIFKVCTVCAVALVLSTGCGIEKKEDVEPISNIQISEVKSEFESYTDMDEIRYETESNINKDEVKTYSIKETFEKTVEENNLKIAENSYDLDALKSMHCNEAILASNEDYIIEYFEFEDEESLKKEFNNQIEYQKSVSSKRNIINKGDNIYEAVTVSTPDVAPRLEETAYNYVLFIKDKKSYISVYQTSKNSNKTEMINLGQTIISKLGI